jgi:hypothetical protein
MEYIAHRVNSINQLKKISKQYGVEIDLRDHGERLILQHDPYINGEDFEDYLSNYDHGTMILNIKSERVEHRALELLKKYSIKKYFFLDSSFPMIVLLSNNGEQNIALRFSEFEAIDTIVNMKNRAKWIWIDCFTKLPINPQNYKVLKSCNYRFCLVSPELQGQEEKIVEYQRYLHKNNIILDAVCTKSHNIKLWKCV